MFTKMKFVLSVAVVLGTACAAQTAAQHPTDRQTEFIVRHQVPASAYESDSVAPAPAQSARMTATYFDPNPRNIQSIHILRIGTARSVDLETGVAGRVQILRFQCDAKCIGTNYFFNRRCPNAGLRPQN